MTTRTLTSAILAITLAVPAAGALAAQPFGRDTVYAAPGASASTVAGSPAVNQLQPNGRDTVFASRKLPANGAGGEEPGARATASGIWGRASGCTGAAVSLRRLEAGLMGPALGVCHCIATACFRHISFLFQRQYAKILRT